MNSEIIDPWTVYWITRLDGINAVAVVLFSLLLLISLVSIAVCLAEDDSPARRVAFVVVPLTLLCAAVAVFVPTTKEACAIYMIPKIANNEDVQGVAAEVRDLARDWIKDLGPKEGK